MSQVLYHRMTAAVEAGQAAGTVNFPCCPSPATGRPAADGRMITRTASDDEEENARRCARVVEAGRCLAAQPTSNSEAR